MRQLADRNNWILLAFAAAITVVNAAKPVHVDDWCTVINAREFAQHPGAPYAFQHDYTPYSSDANATLLPPVVPYCLAIPAASGYPDPVSLKWMLFPFVALFLGALRSLIAWTGCPYPLLFATAFLLGPGVFPGMNVMLDVPATALELAAIRLILKAMERESLWTCVAAGIIAGLGMETKYTAAAAVPVMFLAGLVYGRPRYGFLAAVVAALVFVGIEAWLSAAHGQSHFMAALGIRSGSTLKRILHLPVPILTLIGIVALVPSLLMLHSMGRRKTAAAIHLTAWLTPVALALVPAAWQVWNPSPSPYHANLGLSNILFGLLGILSIDALRRSGIWRNAGPRERFLLGWLVLETASMLVLSPFPAVRRCLGMGVAFTVLAGAVAARRGAIGPRLAAGIACTSIGLGIVYQCLDWAEAATLKKGAAVAVERARERAPDRTVWAYGWSELYFYSREAGAVPFCWNRPRPTVGDLIVTWETDFMREPMKLFPASGLELVETIPMEMPYRLYLGSEHYAGRLPLSPWLGPQPSARIYKVTGTLTQPPP